LWAIASGFVRSKTVSDERLVCRAFGRDLSNPLGLAAGFDKSGIAAGTWQDLGFGFAEVGTVTPVSQSGNPRPRLFRLPEDRALINRLGFNNEGARAVARNLDAAQARLPIGVNIGKAFSTPIEEAAGDYREAYSAISEFAAYVVINVSSPNTPGLRLLHDLAKIRSIIDAVGRSKPLFIKISPDQDDADVIALAQFAETERLGIVATNTTISRAGLVSRYASEAGGLSGSPLRERAEEVCRLVRASAPSCEIVGVGGIMTGEDLYRRLRAGATVCQIYTAFVYRGPAAAGLILGELLELMERDRIGALAEL
jgi:dihydroorotate dehydrogenase